jgi:hypothetical protein
MRMISSFILSAFICSFCLNAGLIFAADKSIYDELTAPAESETQWLWGEIASVDLPKKALLVKYLDYETDQEKEVKIYIDDRTTYENAMSIVEMKPLDTVAIDYIIDPDGANLATNISLEKLENEGASGEAISEELGGLDKIEEPKAITQELVEEKIENQETTVQEMPLLEKIENQAVVDGEPGELEKLETQGSGSVNSSAETPMSEVPSGQ